VLFCVGKPERSQRFKIGCRQSCASLLVENIQRRKGLMAPLSHLRLIQFRAGYNLPVHAAIEYGIFASMV